MISERKLNANRINARASTGPRSAAGKARASRNAQRHGLTLSVLGDPTLSAELKALGKKIAGEGADETLRNLGTQIAAAQIDLLRVRQACKSLYEQAFNRSDQPSHDRSAGERINDWTSVTEQLLILDRYERRAVSRRKRAIRALDFAKNDKFKERDKAFDLP